VRANVVTPGWTQAEHTMERGATDLAPLLDATPVGRLSGPDDVDQAVRFLLGDGARQITGADLVVDGGRTCRAPTPC